MQMRRTQVVASLRPQQLADGTIDRDRIAGRLDAAKAEVTVLAGREFSTQVHVGLIRILIFIKSFRRRVPHVDLYAFDRPAGLVLEPGVDKQRRTGRRRADNRTAVFGWRRV